MSSEKNSKIIFLYLLAPIAIWCIAWFILDSGVSSLHAFKFLVHQDGVLFIGIMIFDVGLALVCSIGTYFDWFTIVTRKVWWISSIVFMIAAPAMLVYTRDAANDDPNISFRYHAYALTQGWKD